MGSILRAFGQQPKGLTRTTKESEEETGAWQQLPLSSSDIIADQLLASSTDNPYIMHHITARGAARGLALSPLRQAVLLARQRAAWTCPQCSNRSALRRRYATTNPADDPAFTSILDKPTRVIRTNRKHSWGLAVLALMPITAFALGTWQVQRLGWKTDLIARFEDRLVRDPLPLPPSINPEAIPEFDYRRVTATGVFRHDQEMLIGPRMHDGNDGYLVVTPLERTFPGYSGNSKILVSRGWITKAKAEQSSRPASLQRGTVTVQGLLREPWEKNMFTPVNDVENGKFYFPDVEQMAKLTGSQPVWIEETMTPDLITAYNREDAGVPIGRAPAVNLRNNHTQYIFTWYSLAAATSVMLWMVVKKPEAGARLRQSRML